MFHSQSHYFMSGSYNCINCFGLYRKAVTEETLFSLILDLFLSYKYQLLMYFGVIKPKNHKKYRLPWLQIHLCMYYDVSVLILINF
jgi:hypothetical protein